MRVLITGGTGFIGRALCERLTYAGHEVIVWSRQAGSANCVGAPTLVTTLDALPAGSVQAVFNLAGAPIADQRWTASRKRLLVESRIHSTSAVVEWMRRTESRPQVLVSASAVGYYGEQGDREVTEETAPTPGFTHDLCAAWEREAMSAQSLGVRVCVVRTGVVFGRDGGALAKMAPAFKLGLGGRLGAGKHYVPWIHRDDTAAIFHWLMDTPGARGAYNASAPNPVTNAELTRILAAILGRPAFMAMPARLLTLLLGEMAELLLGSDRMIPARLLQAGFHFRYPELTPALRDIFARRS
jgi:uncharacterized protein